MLCLLGVMKRTNLVSRIYNAIGPEVHVDHKNRTYEIIREGFFLTHLTEAYYTLKKYKRIEKED